MAVKLLTHVLEIKRQRQKYIETREMAIEINIL